MQLQSVHCLLQNGATPVSPSLAVTKATSCSLASSTPAENRASTEAAQKAQQQVSILSEKIEQWAKIAGEKAARIKVSKRSLIGHVVYQHDGALRHGDIHVLRSMSGFRPLGLWLAAALCKQSCLKSPFGYIALSFVEPALLLTANAEMLQSITSHMVSN